MNQFNRKLSSCLVFLTASVAAIAAAGCNATDPGALGQNGSQINFGTPGGNSNTAPGTVIGPTCKSSDSHHICLALHYVVYTDANGAPEWDQQTAINNMGSINQIWNQCNIGFQIEKYDAVNPANYGLSQGAGALNELDKIRQTFASSNMLLNVVTGDWGTTKNAWTAMPGENIYGAIYERFVGNYPQIMAHELGHYLGLDHVADDSDVMNAIIYPTSTALAAYQCDTARATAQQYWSAMVR